MDDSIRTMGQRIVEAARLAAAAHLRQAQFDSLRQNPIPGGAGRGLFKDEVASREGSLPRLTDRTAG
jgi:hypothetical protein